MRAAEPARDCGHCPRLVKFREHNRQAFPGWHNAPVAAFGTATARLLIVGLAPGLRGANCTGRPFTGDHAGQLLYATLLEYGFAIGNYQARADDDLRLVDCRITNAVRCVPPQNKPTGAEVTTCRRFLEREIQELPRLCAIVALGTVAHGSVLAALGLTRSHWPFAHGAIHQFANGVILADSYHCSRYNLNTGRLTEPMFHAVFRAIRRTLETG